MLRELLGSKGAGQRATGAGSFVGLLLLLLLTGCAADDAALEAPEPSDEATVAVEAADAPPERQSWPKGLTPDSASAYAKTALRGQPREARPSVQRRVDPSQDPRVRRVEAKREAAAAVRRELAELNRARYGSDLGAASASEEALPVASADGQEQSRPRVVRRSSSGAQSREQAVRERMLQTIRGGPQQAAPQQRPAAAVQAAALPEQPTRQSEQTTPAVTSESSRIQLMALSSRQRIQEVWEGLRQEHQDLLGEKALVVDPVEVTGKGLLYRLQVGPFGGRAAADAVCRSLKGRGQDCFVVRG